MKTKMPTFRSIFAVTLTQYITMRTRMGIRSNDYWLYLAEFDQYVYEHREVSELTQELAITVACLHPTNTEAQCARRYSTIRLFADYLMAIDPGVTPLDPYALHFRRHRPPADILTWEQIASVMQAVKHISPKHPIAGYTLQALIGLAACTGMRLGEIVSLDRADVDNAARVIHIRNSKFAKSRLVPVQASTITALMQYAGVRDATYPAPQDPAFFLNQRALRMKKDTIDEGFVFAARRCGLREAEGPGPHFHSLRHTYAVRCLEKWYREGRDVNAMLPILATYMGHVHYTSTAYYITAVPELLALAAQRREAAGWLTELEAPR
ncbi:MAG: tyrosine-type recombinase/integrase [Armatimonadota bacterium]